MFGRDSSQVKRALLVDSDASSDGGPWQWGPSSHMFSRVRMCSNIVRTCMQATW